MKNLKKILLIIMILITVISIDIKPVKAESKSKNIVTNNVYMLKKKSSKKKNNNGVYNPDFDVQNFIDSKGSNKYKVNCSDFYYLQVAYRAMFFIGPFIYIIFAAFDFIKIVTLAPEMCEAKQPSSQAAKESGKLKVESGKLDNFQFSTFNFQL